MFGEDGEHLCPVDQETVETYLQILKPAYEFSIYMQTSTASISEVVPAVRRLVYMWSVLNVTEQYKPLCQRLISSTLTKFKYELNSPLYKVRNFVSETLCILF